MTSDPASSGPLAGLRVLDLSRVLAGPLATQTLADLGADVLKIERPPPDTSAQGSTLDRGDSTTPSDETARSEASIGSGGRDRRPSALGSKVRTHPGGDDTRTWGPPFIGPELSTYFVSVNRSKASLTVDLATERGREQVLQLAEQADVLVENFRPGGATALGLGEDAVRPRCPGLIYASVRGFDGDGPDAQRPGYDAVVQAAAGLMSITGEADRDPVKVGVAMADVLAGQNLTTAILAALFARARTGRGQRVEVSLEGSQVAALVNVASAYLNAEEVPRRFGTAHPNLVPYQTFAAADGPLVVAVGNDAQFRALCAVLEAPTWAVDERFITNAERVRNRATLVGMMQEKLQTRPRAAWGAELDAAGVPWGPVRSIPEVFEANPALAVPMGDGQWTVRSPLHLSDTPVVRPRPAPRVGAGGADRARAWLARPEVE